MATDAADWSQPLHGAAWGGLIGVRPDDWNSGVLEVSVTSDAANTSISDEITSDKGKPGFPTPDENLHRAIRELQLAYYERDWRFRRALIRVWYDFNINNRRGSINVEY